MAKRVPTTPTTILRRKQVEARVGLRRSTIYQRVADRTFPAPVSLGARAVGWLEHEVDEWLRARVAESRRGPHEPRKNPAAPRQAYAAPATDPTRTPNFRAHQRKVEAKPQVRSPR